MPRRGESQFGDLPKPSSGTPFPSTHWSLIHRAREGSKEDLESLCRAYYIPVRRFVQSWRKVGMTDDRLNDLTQGFFTKFLEKDLKRVTKEIRFRGFLKVACRSYYVNWVESELARLPKHGKLHGLNDAEGKTIDLPLSEEDFSSGFDENVARAFLDEAQARLRDELIGSGREIYWKVFEGRMKFDGGAPTEYKKLSQQLGPSVYDVRNYLTAARKLFRRILEELAQQRFEDPESELRDLGVLKYLK